MPRLVAVMAVAAIVAGCTTWDLGARWERSNTMMQQMTYDNMTCGRLDEEVKRTPETLLGGLLDLAVLTFAEASRIARYDDCMTSKGYVRSGYVTF